MGLHPPMGQSFTDGIALLRVVPGRVQSAFVFRPSVLAPPQANEAARIARRVSESLFILIPTHVLSYRPRPRPTRPRPEVSGCLLDSCFRQTSPYLGLFETHKKLRWVQHIPQSTPAYSTHSIIPTMKLTSAAFVSLAVAVGAAAFVARALSPFRL